MQHVRRWGTHAAAVVALAILVTTAAKAQSDCTRFISCNSQTSAVLDFATAPDGACLDASTHRYQLFYFSALAHARLIIDVTSAVFAPAVDLVSPSNVVFASANNDSRSSTVRIDVGTPVAGDWLIRVRNLDVGSGGPYTLSLQCQGGVSPAPAPQPQPVDTGFTISVNPPAVSLPRGGNANLTASITPIAPFNGTVSVSVAFPSGVSGSPLTFSFPAPGNGTQSVDLAVSVAAPGGNASVVFHAIGSDGTTKDRVASLFVDAPCTPPGANGQPTSVSVITGASAHLVVTPTGSGPFAYQWYSGFSGSTVFPIENGQSSSYDTPPITAEQLFWARVFNECGSRDSGTFTVTSSTSQAKRRAARH